MGVSGQDGGYVAGRCLERGARVIGVDRRVDPPDRFPDRYLHVRLDLSRQDGALADLLNDEKPDYVFHLAAAHGPDGAPLEDIWREAAAVNVGALQTCLDHGRRASDMRILYASSVHIFGLRPAGILNEKTSKTPVNLYGITKKQGCDLIDYYRAYHGVQASAAHLFNHESERRPDGYFIPKLVNAVVAAVRGEKRQPLRTLNFFCDWGAAEEYADILADLIETAPGEDVIVATGRTWHARDFTRAVFARFDLDSKDHIVELEPAAHAESYAADTSKLQRLLGRTPKTNIVDLCTDMIRKKLQCD
ncbi:MAG: GDP-mannose 4,6-dehydratase [Pseudomonadota bacterium]